MNSDQGQSNESSNSTPSKGLDGNAAVSLAAEQAKHTADKNLPVFGDLPIPEAVSYTHLTLPTNREV